MFNVALLSVVLYQFVMLFYFYRNDYYFEAVVIFLVILVSVGVNLATAEPLFDLSSISDENAAQGGQVTTKYIDRWRLSSRAPSRSEYSHPLYVKRMASFTDELEEENKYNELERVSAQLKKDSVRSVPLLSDLQVGSGN